MQVEATALLLEETSNTVGQTVEEKSIQQLPLNGRNYLQLGTLTAGAVPNTRSRDRSFSAYGNRGLQNAFLLDGARNQNYMRGLDNRARDAMRPSLEAIAEFKVQTSNYSAEYGASAGAVVNVVTKSGTNELHGSAFEFLRNNAFDARDYFLPAATKQPLYIQHQYRRILRRPDDQEPRLVARGISADAHHAGRHAGGQRAAGLGAGRHLLGTCLRSDDDPGQPRWRWIYPRSVPEQHHPSQPVSTRSENLWWTAIRIRISREWLAITSMRRRS